MTTCIHLHSPPFTYIHLHSPNTVSKCRINPASLQPSIAWSPTSTVSAEPRCMVQVPGSSEAAQFFSTFMRKPMASHITSYHKINHVFFTMSVCSGGVCSDLFNPSWSKMFCCSPGGRCRPCSAWPRRCRAAPQHRRSWRPPGCWNTWREAKARGLELVITEETSVTETQIREDEIWRSRLLTSWIQFGSRITCFQVQLETTKKLIFLI